jgi:hypothetical protein
MFPKGGTVHVRATGTMSTNKFLFVFLSRNSTLRPEKKNEDEDGCGGEGRYQTNDGQVFGVFDLLLQHRHQVSEHTEGT